MNHGNADLKKTGDRLLVWMVGEGFRGWDPHDGLNSPLLKPLSRVHRWAGVAGLQAVKRSRLNLRPLFRVPKGRKGRRSEVKEGAGWFG